MLFASREPVFASGCLIEMVICFLTWIGGVAHEQVALTRRRAARLLPFRMSNSTQQDLGKLII